MRRFWDRRAREDAFYFVDNRLDYGDPDVQRFWDGGVRDLSTILSRLGARIQPTDRVVEIGCGVGRLTRPIASAAQHVWALDVSAEMLERARSNNAHLSNVTWIQGDGTSLAGIDDASVDVCISHVVFQHIPDPAVTLSYVSEMGRVLVGGGWAAFQISNDPRVHRSGAAQHVRGRLATLLGRSPRGQSDPAWLGSAVGLDELADAATAGGLTIEATDGAGTQFCLVLARRLPR
jgi:SAM-dependent methyltransferase